MLRPKSLQYQDWALQAGSDLVGTGIICQCGSHARSAEALKIRLISTIHLRLVYDPPQEGRVVLPSWTAADNPAYIRGNSIFFV